MNPTDFEKCPTRGVVEFRLGAIDSKLGEIFEQTKKTNGRVNAIEIWKATALGTIKGARAGWLALAGVIGWMIHFLI